MRLTSPKQHPGSGPAQTDAELVQAARKGDKRAFVEIVARHQAMVCGVTLGILGDFGASEDAGQEAFLTAWRRFDDLRDPSRLRPWLGQIARHAALAHKRRQRPQVELLEDSLIDHAPAPDETVASEEEALLVQRSLSKLPENYRLPLVLYYREGQSVRAVASTLDISEDAVKQRLARGREMLRDQMSTVLETALTKLGPTVTFTVTVAAAIGALSAPAAIAAGVFAPASGTVAAASGSSTAPLVTAMSTSKTILVTTALVAAACVPIGYHLDNRGSAQVAPVQTSPEPQEHALALVQEPIPSYEHSALFQEWITLHDQYGTNAQAMPVLYGVIKTIKDPFRRRGFRAALIAEWVEVDPAGGLQFFLGQDSDQDQRRQFFQQWLDRDPRVAVDSLMTSPGWEKLARHFLPDIAKSVPERVAVIAQRLPEPDNFWDTQVQDAFAVLARGDLTSARSAAEALTGPNRTQALAGVAEAWAKSDLSGAIAWARSLPDGTDGDEIIRVALMGAAAIDPAAALDQVGIVPAGGRHAYFATTTGARVLRKAAEADFDRTVEYVGSHPGRLNYEDMMGIVEGVTDRLNAGPAQFLDNLLATDSLEALVPAIGNALLNRAGGQREAIWEWLQAQPESETINRLKEDVLNSSSYQDPGLAMRLVQDLPAGPEADRQLEQVARSLFNGGSMLHRFDQLMEEAPDRLREPILEAAFLYLRPDHFSDPEAWVARFDALPEEARSQGAAALARAWAGQSPEQAVGWVDTLQAGDVRSQALAGVISTWSTTDPYGAADWVDLLPPGSDRDYSAAALVTTIAERFPSEAWEWALSISEEEARRRAAAQAVKVMAQRDPATAQQWIDAGPFSAEIKADLHAAVTSGDSEFFNQHLHR